MSLNYYTIEITGGTSDGPYTIYYDVIGDNNIATKYSSGDDAINITLTEMEGGVNVNVPDTTNTIILYNQLCDVAQSETVLPNIQINDFCITYSLSEQIHFISDGYDNNGNPTWVDDNGGNCEVFWDTNINEWKLTCLLDGDQIFSTDPVTSNPPINGWYGIGRGNSNPIANLGECEEVSTLNLTTTVNQPGCVCDASITLLVNGGAPPYQYSKDNGVNYVNSPIFTDLCPGNYSVSVKDSNDNIVYDSVVINPLVQSENYFLSITTTSDVITDTDLVTEIDYSSTINVSPPLPNGVTINVDVQHLGVFENFTKPDFSTIDREVILKKNTTPISITTTNDTTYTEPGPSQCGSTTKQFTATTNNWNSITIGNGDDITIETTSIITRKNQESVCGGGSDTNTFSLSNPTVVGCNCCDVNIVGTITTTTTNPNLTIVQGTISSNSNSSDACNETLDSICYISVSNQNAGIGIGSVIYNNPSGVSPVIGDGDYYKIRRTDNQFTISGKVNSDGEVEGPVSICP